MKMLLVNLRGYLFHIAETIALLHGMGEKPFLVLTERDILEQGDRKCRTGMLSATRTTRPRRTMGRRSAGVRLGRIRSTSDTGRDVRSSRTRMGNGTF